MFSVSLGHLDSVEGLLTKLLHRGSSTEDRSSGVTRGWSTKGFQHFFGIFSGNGFDLLGRGAVVFSFVAEVEFPMVLVDDDTSSDS